MFLSWEQKKRNHYMQETLCLCEIKPKMELKTMQFQS